MSGTQLRSYQRGNHRCYVDAIAQSLLKSIRNDTDLIKFMKHLPSGLIVKASMLPYAMDKPLNFLTWAPMIEGLNIKVRNFVISAADYIHFSPSKKSGYF